MKTTVKQRRQFHTEATFATALDMLSEAMARFPVGTLVGLSHDLDEVGVVMGYNFAAEGYYPTCQYPLFVLFGGGEIECSLDMVVKV